MRLREKDGLYYCTASIQSGSKFLTDAVEEVGYFRVTNGALTLSPSRFEKQNLEDYTKLRVDGVPVHVGAYTINGNTYFKLQDLGNIFSFTVGWEEATGTITIDT